MPATIAEAWEAAVEVTAAAYRVDPAILRAESRGRGPKPPLHAREAKKVAVYLTVVLADCGYAELARAIGYHRDTICSHCAEIRERSDDDEIEQRLDELRGAAAVRIATGPARDVLAMEGDTSQRALLLSLHAKLDRVAAALGLDFVGGSSVHPTNAGPEKKNIVPFPGGRTA